MKAALYNYKMNLQYDGTNYSGWQVQENALTIQQVITDSIKIILKEDVSITGSGRTDAGVHALGQVANFKSASEIDSRKFLYSLNSILPVDISVIEINKVHYNFNSRFNAKKRIYLYLFTKHKSPFYDKYSYFIHYKIDCDRLNNLSKALIVKEDFSSFCRTISTVNNKTCEVKSIRWKVSKGFIIFTIEADRFLHGMVRAIIGTLLYAYKNNLNEDYLKEILASKERSSAGESVPAKGLFLFKVKY